MNPVALLFFSLLWARVFAVKEYLFKNCAQSGFCHRNRHLATQNFESPYFVDPASIVHENGSVAGTIYKKLPLNDVVALPFDISLLVGDSVRFQIDENRQPTGPALKLNPRRFRAAETAFDGPENEKQQVLSKDQVSVLDNGIVLVYGPDNEFSARLDFAPLKLAVSRHGKVQAVFNARKLLNIEHWRPQKENSAHLWPYESEFDMFSDSFGDLRDDTKPFGPESVAADVRLIGFDHVFGLPEHADLFSLKDTTDSEWPYRLYNVDIFEYETESRMPMYGSIPLLVGVKPDAAAGIFWVNAADTFVDIKKGHSNTDKDAEKSKGHHSLVDTHWMSETGTVDIVIILAATPEEINAKYGQLTGHVSLPQEFALGYHQCRWNYNDEKDVLDVHAQMDAHGVPYDTIWLDIEYADKKKYFTWDKEAFPDPEGMAAELARTGRNLVVIVDPHLKTGYSVSEGVEKLGISIKDRANSTFKGHCWPGESVWIDAMNPNAQAYWDELFLPGSVLLGATSNVHLWNDMNEPSVFSGPETSMPKDTLHWGDFEHRAVHNAWGQRFHELTFESLEKRTQYSKRPFILTRSYFAGSQRSAAMWTGDNMARWEYLRASLPMVLTSNAVGMPFAGADVGGFFGDPSNQLLVRWYQTGLFYPFFRAHAHIDSRRREPWIPGEPFTSHIRDAVRLRYRLLPTLYTLFHDASVTGSPVWRPMVWEHPDSDCYDVEDQFYLGQSGLLVKPVTEENANSVDIFFPANERYYDFTSGHVADVPPVALSEAGKLSRTVSLEDIPMYVKGGSVFALRDRYRRSSKLMKADPFHLVVGLDANGVASGKLYLDDGESYDYKNGQYTETKYEMVAGQLKSQVNGDPNYALLLSLRIEKITILGAQDISSIEAKQDGRLWSVEFVQHKHYVEILNPRVGAAANWTINVVHMPRHEKDEL